MLTGFCNHGYRVWLDRAAKCWLDLPTRLRTYSMSKALTHFILTTGSWGGDCLLFRFKEKGIGVQRKVTSPRSYNSQGESKVFWFLSLAFAPTMVTDATGK